VTASRFNSSEFLNWKINFILATNEASEMSRVSDLNFLPVEGLKIRFAKQFETRNAKPETLMTYLALGDSYTIGEGVTLYESFPYQVVQMLRKDGIMLEGPEIIAKTGWTTDELQSAISSSKLLPSYDFVSLLIGVNNQYRGRPIDEYRQQFESLLKKSVRLAGNRSKRVIVISIPDWGAAPFAGDKDRKKISEEIDDFNLLNKSLAILQETQYIDITTGSREAADVAGLVAPDGLHPSGKEYERWAKLVAAKFKNELPR